MVTLFFMIMTAFIEIIMPHLISTSYVISDPFAQEDTFTRLLITFYSLPFFLPVTNFFLIREALSKYTFKLNPDAISKKSDTSI